MAGSLGLSGPLVVALDSSTTACKALAFDARGHAVATARAPLRTSSPTPGWQEQDAGAWWTAGCRALTELAAQVDVSNVRGLCITHQRETFVCLDGDGAPLRPAVLWLDTRAAAQVRRIGSEGIHRLSGKPPSTTPSLYKLAWLAEHEPEILRRTATVADVHAFLVGRLTGRRVTSWASADPLGVVDMTTFRYSPVLLAAAGLREDQLPELAAPGEILGEISGPAARATGLPAGLPVVAGAGDGQCAGLGAAVCEPGLAYLNLGTGVTLGAHAADYHASLAFRTLSSPIAGSWTLEALLASGALSLAWFRTLVMRDEASDAEERLDAISAGVPPGSDGLLFLPYLTSAETPYWDPSARGAWVGLRDHHGVGHMHRAMLEGIAFEQRLVLSLMETATGDPADRIRAMGGGSRSRVWLRVLADVLERPVETSEQSEVTALGAAILAAAALAVEGETDVVATARRMTGSWRAVEPDAGTGGRYRQLAAVYDQLYPVLAPLFRKLGEVE